jgi:hypothetical protein
MKYRSLAALLALSIVSVTAPVVAHHSITSEFDPSKEFTVKGVLTKIEWSNPHVYTYADVTGSDGKVESWAFEGNPPGTLHRAGVKKEDWLIGQTVTITAVAAKDGSKHLGFLKMIKYADGHALVFRVGGE